jgi:hypothetical protein
MIQGLALGYSPSPGGFCVLRLFFVSYVSLVWNLFRSPLYHVLFLTALSFLMLFRPAYIVRSGPEKIGRMS